MSNELIIEQSRMSYVDIPAIIGGAALALALSLVLANFGATIGLAFADDYDWSRENAMETMIAMGLWTLWVQVLASFAGGYLAGRMRRPVAGATAHERDIRDGAHGLLVWAFGTVAVAVGMGLASALAALVNTPEAASAVEQTQDVLDREHNVAIIMAFITASSALVAAVASWWAGTKGGDHRDRAVDHSRYVAFR